MCCGTSGARLGAAGPAAERSIVEGRMPDATERCGISRRGRVSTATKTPSGWPGRGPGLERGRNPRGWKADVRYVPSSENRSHGARLGDRLERLCNGTRFRYVFRDRPVLRRAAAQRRRPNAHRRAEERTDCAIRAEVRRLKVSAWASAAQVGCSQVRPLRRSPFGAPT